MAGPAPAIRRGSVPIPMAGAVASHDEEAFGGNITTPR
jgi:hypothetical protein